MVYFFYGEDAFRSGEKTFQLKDKFLGKNPSASGLKVFSFEEKSKDVGIEWLERAIGEKNLFSAKQLIIIRNFLKNCSKASNEQMIDFLKKNENIFEDKDNFLVFWEESLPTASHKLFQFLLKLAKKEEFSKLSGPRLNQWIEQQVQEVNPNVQFSKLALEKIVTYVGPDTLKLKNEIEKLVEFKDRGSIEEEDVEIMVKAETSGTIFEITDALSAGNKKRALELIENQLEKGEDPYYLFFMCLGQFRNLIRVSEFYFQRQTNHLEIAKKISLHPFVVQKALRQLARYTPESLRKSYQLFQELDLKMKTGQLEARLALDILVLKV